MFRSITIAALSLLLLTQGLLPAWAAPARQAAVVEHLQQDAAPATPCHGSQASGSTHAGPAVPMDCCSSGDCAHCVAGCMASLAIPAVPAALADYLSAHYALLREAGAEPAAPPLDLLRPPISYLR